MRHSTDSNHYSVEFRDAAVQKCVAGAKTVSEVAAELAIPAKLLRRWVVAYRDAELLTAAERTDEIQRLRTERQRLLDEIADLRAQAMRDKKAK